MIEQLKKRPNSLSLESSSASKEELMDISDLEQIDLISLMYQTGYFTIKDYVESSKRYHLRLPNEEVRIAFISSLVKNFAGLREVKHSNNFIKALENNNLEVIFGYIESGFASFAYQLFVGARESTYQGMLLAIMCGMGFDPLSEVPTNTGRIDIVMETEAIIYIIEIKLDGRAEVALQQIVEKQYFKPYLSRGKKILMVGANFSSESRNISSWEMEEVGEKV